MGSTIFSSEYNEIVVHLVCHHLTLSWLSKTVSKILPVLLYTSQNPWLWMYTLVNFSQIFFGMYWLNFSSIFFTVPQKNDHSDTQYQIISSGLIKLFQFIFPSICITSTLEWLLSTLFPQSYKNTTENLNHNTNTFNFLWPIFYSSEADPVHTKWNPWPN